jgi:hypothetical protein
MRRTPKKPAHHKKSFSPDKTHGTQSHYRSSWQAEKNVANPDSGPSLAWVYRHRSCFTENTQN